MKTTRYLDAFGRALTALSLKENKFRVVKVGVALTRNTGCRLTDIKLNINLMAPNKRMQTDQTTRYAPGLVADAGR